MTEWSGDRKSIIIGTRGSRLAIWQAEWVQEKLQALAPELEITLQRIQTSGDKILDVPLAKIGGKGLFVKEIEEALLRGDIDLAVHSMKDVPSVLPDQLAIVCVPEREDPRDALVSGEGHPLNNLKQGARIGTSSLRRQAQLLYYRGDFQIDMLRGNLDTRLKKAHQGIFDAVVLAAAGLRRMGWTEEVTEYLHSDISLPAVGQGALGLEGRRDDRLVMELVGKLEHVPSRIEINAERAFLTRLEGGCQVPIAGYAVVEDTQLTMDGLIASVDGQRYVREKISGSTTDAERLGIELADRLLAAGGRSILDEIYNI